MNTHLHQRGPPTSPMTPKIWRHPGTKEFNNEYRKIYCWFPLQGRSPIENLKSIPEEENIYNVIVTVKFRKLAYHRQECSPETVLPFTACVDLEMPYSVLSL